MTVFQVIFAVLLIIANGQEISIEYDSGIVVKDLYKNTSKQSNVLIRY